MSALQKILDDPDDDGARAAYADEIGGPRGELIHVQLRLDRADPESDEYPDLLRRSDAMLAEHGTTWFPLQGKDRVRVRRGFVEAMGWGETFWWERLVAREPVTEFLSPVGNRASWERLREIRQRFWHVDDYWSFADLLERPALKRLGGHIDFRGDARETLEQLGLEGLDVRTEEAVNSDELAWVWRLPLVSLRMTSVVWPRFEGVFRGRRLGLSRPELPALLDGVELDHLETSGERLPALRSEWPGLARLGSLSLRGMGPGLLGELARAPLDGLRELTLVHRAPFGPDDLAVLRGAPWLANLRTLRLRGQAAGLAELVPRMPRLVTLETSAEPAPIRAVAGPRLARIGDAHRRWDLDWWDELP